MIIFYDNFVINLNDNFAWKVVHKLRFLSIFLKVKKPLNEINERRWCVKILKRRD